MSTAPDTVGGAIGRIAANHWWPVSRLLTEFKVPLGALGKYPNDWRVDELKLAALLRVADACHLDERRAPSFLRALRKSTGTADLHWIFQSKLFQPFRDGDLLVFTSNGQYAVEEASAWWLCFDTLKEADRNLRETNAMIFSVRPTPRFVVKGIKNH